MYYYHFPYGYPLNAGQANPVSMSHDYNRQQKNFNIPYMPILGKQSFSQLIKDIHKSIVDEATAVDFYARLSREAPDELHKDFIRHAYEDEQKHLQAFSKLYTHFTGQKPQYRIRPVQYANYKAGILKALNDELEAAEFYRDIQLSSSDHLVKDTFFFAMTDEMEHAVRFGVLYNSK